MQIPPYLQPGDTIGITCPAGFLPIEKTEACIKTLQQWGLKVQLGNTVGTQFHYFSGTDEERLTDLQNMLDNPSIKAILFGRGGYGVSRIIDNINWDSFIAQPKWLIGFSDITVIHAHIHNSYNICSLHASMAGAFANGANEYIQSIQKCLTGVPTIYTCKAHKLNTNGNVTGQLIGGNLTIIAHLLGTSSAYQTAGKILYLEDVGEYLYNIDRMMIQLKRNGVFDHLAGLIFGGFSDLKDTTVPFGCSIHEILASHICNYKFPVCFDFPVSHEKNNYAIKNGGMYELNVGSQLVTLKAIN